MRPSENWIFDNCDFVRWAFHNWSPALAGTLYTGQVPAPGTTPVLASGYYVQDTVFATKNDGVITGSIGKTSEVVWLAP